MGAGRYRANPAAGLLRAGRWGAGILGAAALIGAVVVLAAPASLHAVDRTGTPIPCGTGMDPSYEIATQEDALNRHLHENRGRLFQPSGYTDDCAALISERRSVAFPTAAVGAALLIGAIVTGVAVGVRWPVRGVVRSRQTTPDTDVDAPTPALPAVPTSAPRDVVSEAAVAVNRLAASPRSLGQA